MTKIAKAEVAESLLGPLLAFQDPDGCPVRLQQFDEFLILYFVGDAVKRVLILDISEVG